MAQSLSVASVTVTTRAKINLTLDVLDRRVDGYHDILSVMQSLELGDQLLISDSGTATSQPDPASGLSVDLTVTGYRVPTGASNLAVRAAHLVLTACEVNRALTIRLHKRLPVAAGLAGGSSDAAGVIVGLNSLLHLGLSPGEMEALGSKLGADVPFCIRCGTAKAGGTGERLTQLPFLSDLWVVVLVPHIAVPTAEVYGLYDSRSASHISRPDIAAMERFINERDIAGVASALGNVFYPIVSSLHPIVEHMVRFLRREGAMGAMMSGSGPAVFGIASGEARAREICSRAQSVFGGCFAAFTRASEEILVERGEVYGRA